MIKMNTAGRKPKTTQYIVGGGVAVIILLCWISIPLMNNSSLDSAAGPGTPFKTRSADIGSLGSDIPSEGGAPGYSMDGGMTNLTSGENIASSLFQSGPEDEEAAADFRAPELSGPAASGPGSGPGAPAGVTASPAPKGKLSALPSITAGNANSVTTGGKFDRPFGTGAAKPDLGPALDQLSKKQPPAAEKRSALLSMLKDAEDKSVLAARSGNANEARGGASSAFEKAAKADNLNTSLESGAAVAGLSLGVAAQDLKRNDPSRSTNKSTFPQPIVAEDKSKEADEAMKKMIMQMLISAVLGPMMGSIFSGAMSQPGVAPK